MSTQSIVVTDRPASGRADLTRQARLFVRDGEFVAWWLPGPVLWELVIPFLPPCDQIRIQAREVGIASAAQVSFSLSGADYAATMARLVRLDVGHHDQQDILGGPLGDALREVSSALGGPATRPGRTPAGFAL